MSKTVKEIVKSQNERVQELFKLIQEHPELPIVPMVDADLVCDDGGRWLGSWGSAYIDKYLIHNENYIVYEENEPDIVDIFEKVFDYAECGIDEEMPDETALPIMKEKVDSLPWIEAIIINIDMPIPELCE